MDKVLIICGPTATGKTSLALYLSKLVDGELVSADSRQVYNYMDIGTGKDIPPNFKRANSDILFEGKKIPYYTNYTTRIWGYDLVDPDENFSVAEYSEVADLILEDISKRGRLPILVGGSGLYIKAAVEKIGTANIPPNQKLRNELSKKSVDELYEQLLRTDNDKALSMNNSDKNNPRRLIRAIEIAQTGHNPQKKDKQKKYDTLFVGLHTNENFDQLVKRRVDIRLEQGFEVEVKKLKVKNYLHKIPLGTLGYREWREYLLGKMSKADAVKKWVQAERNYAKRQMTWFKKEKRVNWFDVTTKDFKKNVEELVKTWYKQ